MRGLAVTADRAWYHVSVRRVMAWMVVAALIAWLARGVQDAREAARRSQCAGHLSQIALALHNYQSVFGCWPPAYVADENGKPMHSWRVLILPFLEQQPLYNRYDFREPWDGPHNRRLIGAMPSFYACPSHAEKGTTDRTCYVAVVGPGTAFPGSGTTASADIRDGPSHTVMVVEAVDADIPWTEPRDLETARMSFRINDPSRRGPSSRHPGGVNVMFADAHYRFLKDETSAERFKALLTISGRDDDRRD